MVTHLAGCFVLLFFHVEFVLGKIRFGPPANTGFGTNPRDMMPSGNVYCMLFDANLDNFYVTTLYYSCLTSSDPPCPSSVQIWFAIYRRSGTTSFIKESSTKAHTMNCNGGWRDWDTVSGMSVSDFGTQETWGCFHFTQNVCLRDHSSQTAYWYYTNTGNFGTNLPSTLFAPNKGTAGRVYLALDVECNTQYYESSNLCVLCTAGSYCANGNIYQCAAGHISGIGATVCTKCGSKTYANVDHTTCLPCTAGYYCTGTDGLRHLCDPGWIAPASSSLCGKCLAGSFADVSVCRSCPDGSISADAATSCTTCSQGTYANPAHTSCVNCEAGYYCTGGIKRICSAGTYSNALASSCTQCPAGTYSATAGAASCTDCENGYYCEAGSRYACGGAMWSAEKSTVIEDCACCDIGEKVKLDLSGCVGCATGYISSACDATCQMCSAGSYADANQGSCLVCNAGFYCDDGTETQCGTGKYSASGAQADTQCVCCVAGERVRTDQTGCVDCPAGRISNACATSCVICSGTTFANNGGTTCDTCPEGSYCEDGIKILCPVGSYCTGGQLYSCPTGASSPVGSDDSGDCACCGTGMYLDVVDDTCKECDLGYISSVDCSESCTLCGVGKYANQAKTVCLNCPAGSYCSNGKKTQCPVEKWSLPQSTVDTDCQCCLKGEETTSLQDGCQDCVGENVNDASCGVCAPCSLAGYVPNQSVGNGHETCVICSPGTYSINGACAQCRAGFYCPLGLEIECEMGTVSPSGSSTVSNCVVCDPGLIPDPNDLSSCIPCPLGKLCLLGVESNCPPGSIAPSTGLSSCTECERGTIQNGNDFISCDPCVGNTVAESTGQTECTTCDFVLLDVQYTPNPEHTACMPCPDGYICDVEGNKLDCDAGHYCKGGVPYPCPVGFWFDEGVNVEEPGSLCPPCPEGFKCVGGEKIECVPSTYCPLGSTYETDCGCNGHGDCFDGPYPGGSCTCFSGYSNEDCSSYTCFSEPWNGRKTCSGVGMCTGHDTCMCLMGYLGAECEVHTCFEISYLNESVCSGHGECKDVNRCKCEKQYSLQNCSLYTPPKKNNSRIVTMSVVLPVALLCVSIIIFSAIALIVLLCCRKAKKELAKYEDIEGIDILLKESEAETPGNKVNLKDLDINEKLFQIDVDDVKMIKKLDAGISGVVFKALWKGQHECAFKLFRVHAFMEDEKFKEFENEVSLLASCRHMYILEFYGAVISSSRIGVVTKFAENGNLRDFLFRFHQKNGEHYPIKERIRFVREIASAMVYLHSNDVIHRDLKLANVVVLENCESRVMDFGCARIARTDEQQKTMTMRVGTCLYMAPEVSTLSGNANASGGKYTAKIDVYSFSMIVYILFREDFGPLFNPFGENLNAMGIEIKVAKENLRPDLDLLSEHTPQWIRRVILRGWDADPDYFEEILQIVRLESEELEKKMLASSTSTPAIPKAKKAAPPPPTSKKPKKAPPVPQRGERN